MLIFFFLQYIENKPGNFIDLETQQVVGIHQGVHKWTVGQRCNLSPFPLPYYVCEKHVESNNIFVVSNLYIYLFTCLEICMYRTPTQNVSMQCMTCFLCERQKNMFKISKYMSTSFTWGSSKKWAKSFIFSTTPFPLLSRHANYDIIDEKLIVHYWGYSLYQHI